jgi:hypothetical protein
MLQIIHTSDPRHINSPLSAQATNVHVDGTDASGTTRRHQKGSRPMHAAVTQRVRTDCAKPDGQTLGIKRTAIKTRRKTSKQTTRGANKAPRIRSRRPSASRGSWPRCGSRSGRAWTRHTCGGKGFEEVDETSSGLLQPARATSHDVHVQSAASLNEHLDSRRWLAAANVPV